MSASGAAAVLSVVPDTSPQDERTAELIRHLRDDVLPAGAHVGGTTASSIDLSATLGENLPLVVMVVLGSSFLLMLLAFRSIVISLKAVLVNLLSVLGAYDVVTLVFQTGTGARLVGLPSEAPIPVIMFAILFGLSMDYEVFLLSRVREELDRTGNARESVVVGLTATARVISSAAAIMVAVFLGFAFDPSVAVKMIGVGLAAAIALDATVVRLLLVPAIMTLLGDRAWYLPHWLDRVLPRWDLHGESEPAPEPVVAQRPGRSPYPSLDPHYNQPTYAAQSQARS